MIERRRRHAHVRVVMVGLRAVPAESCVSPSPAQLALAHSMVRGGQL
jgi:hypothetical protein